MAEFKIPKPVPMASEESKPFWEGCQRQELLLQKCDDCEYYRFPPNILCPRCMSMNYKWTRSSGKATVFTWEVTHQAFYPAWDTPFNVAIVELEEGPRMHSNIVGCNIEDIYMGMPVEVIFEKIEDQDSYLPKFKPVSK